MIGKRETVVQGVSAVLGQWSRPALVTALSLSQYLCLSCVGPSAPVTGTQHVTINLDSATPVNTASIIKLTLQERTPWKELLNVVVGEVMCERS